MREGTPNSKSIKPRPYYLPEQRHEESRTLPAPPLGWLSIASSRYMGSCAGPLVKTERTSSQGVEAPIHHLCAAHNKTYRAATRLATTEA